MNDKPLEVIMNEIEMSFYDIINKSSLPLCVSSLILKKVVDNIERTNTETTNQKIQEYNKIQQQMQQHEEEQSSIQPNEVIEEGPMSVN